MFGAFCGERVPRLSSWKEQRLSGPYNMAALIVAVKSMGIDIDRNLIVAELCRYASHLVDQRLIIYGLIRARSYGLLHSTVEMVGLKMVLEWTLKRSTQVFPLPIRQ